MREQSQVGDYLIHSRCRSVANIAVGKIARRNNSIVDQTDCSCLELAPEMGMFPDCHHAQWRIGGVEYEFVMLFLGVCCLGERAGTFAWPDQVRRPLMVRYDAKHGAE